MKVFLTGITGHMGFNILRSLLEHGYGVTASVRDVEYAAALLRRHLPDPGRVRLVQGDLSDRESLIRGMKGADAVINSAAIVGLRKERPEEQSRTNIEGVLNLLEAARADKVGRFIQISTIQTVKSGTFDFPADETGRMNTECRDPYCTTKLEADSLALSFAAPGFDVILVSPGLLAGPYDFKASAVTNLIKFCRRGLSLFYPPGGITVSDVEQVAESVVASLKKGEPGQRYILGGANLSYRQIYGMLHRVTGCPPPLIPLPAWLLRTAAACMEFLEHRCNVNFTVNSHRVRLVCQKEFYSSLRARETLGFGEADVEKAFRSAYVWLVGNGIIKDKKLSRELNQTKRR